MPRTREDLRKHWVILMWVPPVPHKHWLFLVCSVENSEKLKILSGVCRVSRKRKVLKVMTCMVLRSCFESGFDFCEARAVAFSEGVFSNPHDSPSGSAPRAGRPTDRDPIGRQYPPPHSTHDPCVR